MEHERRIHEYGMKADTKEGRMDGWMDVHTDGRNNGRDGRKDGLIMARWKRRMHRKME